MGIRVVTDSTVNLDPVEAKTLGIVIVPIYLFFGNEEYREGENLSFEQFAEMLKTSSSHPQTAPPTAAEFVKIYEELIKTDDTILSIHVSSKLSNTYRNASIAAGMVKRSHPEANIHTVDSELVDLALGIAVKEAAEMASKGNAIEEIIAYLQELKKKIGVFVYVDTLEYLKKGGRVTRLAAFFGSLLNLKPILKLEDGELKLAEKASGKEKALETTLNLLRERVPEGARIRLVIGNVFADADADRLLNTARSQFQCTDTCRMHMSASVAIHAGPGSVAIGYRIES